MKWTPARVSTRHAEACATLLLCAGVGMAQNTPIIKSETRIVLVDAVVTGKKGEIVRDLTAKDFHVWEDKKEETIQSVTLESNARAAEPSASYLTLMFDYTGMDAGDQIRAREAAAGFIDANAAGDHEIAVAIYDGELRVEQGFTGNAGRLKDALKLRPAVVNNAAAGTGALADIGQRSLFRSLQELAEKMGAAPGRKTLVLLAGGITLANEQKGALNAAIAACNKANVAVYPVDVRESTPAALITPDAVPGGRGGNSRFTIGNGRGGSRGSTPQGDTDPSAALDPGGASQQVLFALATGTGGFVIRNPSELPKGLQEISAEQDQYYVLSYTPPESKEGVCHTLHVKVDRSGTNVRARSSYCTGKAQELLTGTAAERNLESRAANAQTGSAVGAMQLPFFYTGANTARVNLAMEIAPGAVKLDRKKDGSAEIEILGIASQAQGPDEGSAAARFSGTLTVDAGEASKPLHYEKEFKIAPGTYKVAVVFSSGGENPGKLELPLKVEPYQPGALAISGIALGKEIHKGGESGSSLFDDKTPLETGGIQLTPSGSTVFAKPEKAYCYFEVYRGDAAAGAMAVRIVDAKSGAVKWDGGSVKMDLAAAAKIPVGLELPIEPLPPGAYRVEIVAQAGDQSATRSVDFEVK